MSIRPQSWMMLPSLAREVLFICSAGLDNYKSSLHRLSYENTMACHATWTVQASVAGTAATIAALLGSLTAFESILRVPNKANVPLFRFTWMPELNDPINKLLQTIGVEVQRIIDTKMKAKITEIRPAAILFLAGHRLLIPEGEAAIFFPLPIPMEVLKRCLSSEQK
ncbi:hypothetical protein T440DRAFT_473855, partial [Plenodomus tracheiphilus IPT5]